MNYVWVFTVPAPSPRSQKPMRHPCKVRKATAKFAEAIWRVRDSATGDKKQPDVFSATSTLKCSDMQNGDRYTDTHE